MLLFFIFGIESMNFNIDTLIFVGFLAINIVLGLTSSRGVKTISEFAVGDRNFSTATIAATIIATWVSGDFFFVNAAETYKSGLVYSFSAFGDIACILLVGTIFAPRMGEFLGKLSIAEAMGSLYGDRIRVITAVSGLMGVAGMIAVQLSVAGMTFEYAFGISGVYGVLSAGIIITMYSALGGIKSVTFTDVIQFFTFGTVIPTIAYAIFRSLDNTYIVFDMLATNPLFNYHTAFDLSNYSTMYHISLFFCFAIPAFNPAIFQRIAMAHDTMQVRRSFLVAAFACFMLLLMISWISILVISIDPHIESGDIIKHIVNKYTFPGLKGLMLVGIMAMVMSTADSFVNATSVLIVHDFCVPLKIKLIRDELFSARIASIFLGVFSIILSLYSTSLIELLTLAYSFYMPIVTTPFIMAVLGFRSSEKSVLIGMMAGFVVVVLWDCVLRIKIVNSVPPAMLANLVFLMSSHYLLRQQGGWVGAKDMMPILRRRQESKIRRNKFWRAARNFSILELCKKNAPKGDGFVSLLGFFVMISVFGSAYTVHQAYYSEYQRIIDILYPICLFSSCALISYPLWLQSWKDSAVLGVICTLIIFFVLTCFSFLMILLSHFGEIQMMVFLVNIIIIASIVTWRLALFTMILGTLITIFYHSHYISTNIEANIFASQFKIVYMLLLLSCAIFLSKQNEVELMNQKIHYLEDESKFHKAEISHLLDMKNEFIRNIEHESRTPITGIASMGQVLYENYDKLTESQRRMAAEEIAKSSERLNSWASNLVDLSKLASLGGNIQKEDVNLSELIEERLGLCIKLYVTAKDQNEKSFAFRSEGDITISCNKYYMGRVIDNLIINAIQHSKCKEIVLALKQLSKDNIEFSVKDNGIGIPPEELHDIFGLLTVSSKSKNASGGRGIGLALAKKVIELHQGRIWTESDGITGATFKFVV